MSNPAIRQALAESQSAIDAIATRPLADVTFENTFLALEQATEGLNLAWGKVTHLQTVADSPALRDAHNAVLPEVSAFFARIPLNAALWTRVENLCGADRFRRASSGETAFPGGNTGRFPAARRGFAARKTDASRSAAKRARATDAEVFGKRARCHECVGTGRLGTKPASPVCHRHAKDAARRSAEAKGIGSVDTPAWRFTLHMPSQEPFMTYLDDAELRREMWTAAVSVGGKEPHDNSPLLPRILALRAEKAALLGKAHFADLTLERRMAKNAATALAFVNDMGDRARTAFAHECTELEEFKARTLGCSTGRLAPWEIAYWAEKLRKVRYDFDEEELRPYFPMDRVIAGLFRTGKARLRIAHRRTRAGLGGCLASRGQILRHARRGRAAHRLVLCGLAPA